MTHEPRHRVTVHGDNGITLTMPAVPRSLLPYARAELRYQLTRHGTTEARR